MDTKTFQKLLFFGTDYIYQDSYENEKLKRLHSKSASVFIKSTMGIMFNIVFSASGFACYPMYLFWFKNERPMTIPIILPFTHPETTLGYYENIANQLVINVTGFFGNIGLECLTAFLINNVFVAVETLCFEMEEFAVGLKSGKIADMEKKLRLRNFLVQVQDIDRQEKKFKKVEQQLKICI